MLEIFLLWKLSEVRDELRNFDAEQDAGAVGIFIMSQIIIWPMSLALLLSKKFKWTTSILISSFAVAMTLVVNWGIYFVVGFVVSLCVACLIAYYLTFAEE